MRRTLLPILMVTGLVLGCGNGGAAPTTAPGATTGPDTTTTTSPERDCIEPPPAQLEAASDLDLAVEPNPAPAGSPAVLTIEPGDLPDDAIVGAGAEWQCWDGTDWVGTHQIVRGFMEGLEDAIPVEPGATTSIPAVGLEIPSSYPILIPDVPPGTYRIVDRALTTGGAETIGFVIVEVTGG